MKRTVRQARQALSRRNIVRRAISAEIFVSQEWHRCMFCARQLDQPESVSALNIAVRKPFGIGESGGGHRQWFRHPQRLRQLSLAGDLREI